MGNGFETVVHKKDRWICHGVPMLPGWYFWDETGDWHGPFSSKKIARQFLKEYCRIVLGC